MGVGREIFVSYLVPPPVLSSKLCFFLSDFASILTLISYLARDSFGISKRMRKIWGAKRNTPNFKAKYSSFLE
jgi:hypothetical protein